jgi:hypothetical protein
MAGPYREHSGVSCPRCATVLESAGDEGLRCSHGCGEWLGDRGLRRLLGTTDLSNIGRGAPYFKVAPLPPTACLRCQAALVDMYRVVAPHDHMTLGGCPAHGVWIEKRSRQDFERAFEPEIARHAETVGLAEQIEARDLTAARRILRLEERVAKLEARLTELSARLPGWD